MLEFGRDFIFMGDEYHLQVGKNDYYADLLFFHRELQCLVAIDLKITDFKPEYLGKMEFYLEALDRDVKKPQENPSVGIILCKSKDEDVVEYAMSIILPECSFHPCVIHGAATTLRGANCSKFGTVHLSREWGCWMSSGHPFSTDRSGAETETPSRYAKYAKTRKRVIVSRRRILP